MAIAKGALFPLLACFSAACSDGGDPQTAAGGTGGSSSPVSDAAAGGGLPPSTSPGCGAVDFPPEGALTLDVDGLARELIVGLPDDYDPSTAHRLIFAWHGQLGTAQQIALSGYYGLEGQAGGTAIFVAAQGLYTATGIGGTGWDNTDGRDIAFTRVMLDHMRTSYCIDDARIFSVGMSYGGIMSNNVGCVLGDVFRAIAPMAGLGPIMVGPCVGQVAVWDAYGSADTLVPREYIELGRDYWVGANHCDATTQAYGGNGCVAYDGCDEGHPVIWCLFDGGHVVPPFATSEIWSFFSQF